MQSESLLASSWVPTWIRRRRKTGTADPSSSLREATEREFLYRGASTLAIKDLTVTPDRASCMVTFYARPIYPSDRRLKQRPWALLFAEQALTDTAKILHTTWRRLPELTSITLIAYRQPLPPQQGAEELIIHLHVANEAVRQKVLTWTKPNPLGLLEYCDIRYEIDPRVGLRGLTKGC